MTRVIPDRNPRPVAPKVSRQKEISALERELDDALKGTFPASDPISSLRMAVQGPQPDWT
jgi:hypothetical protein